MTSESFKKGYDRIFGQKASGFIVDDLENDSFNRLSTQYILDIIARMDKQKEIDVGTVGVQVAAGYYDSEKQEYVADADTVLYNGVEKWTVDHYKEGYDSDEAIAWRELWKKMLKYNKGLKATKKKPHKASPLQRALQELERLQALDRTLERRLKDA